MPAAMESSPNPPKTLEILWKSLYFLQISSKIFFFFWKSRKISPDLENLLRDLAGRARDLSAGLEISRPGRNPPNLTAPKNRFPALPLPSKFFLVGCKLSKSLIPDVLEFLPDFNSPQPNGNFECRGSPDSSDWLIGSHIGRTPNPRVPEPAGNQ